MGPEIVGTLAGVVLALVLIAVWMRQDHLAKKRLAIQRGKDYMTDFLAQQGYNVGEPWPTQTVQLPSIPIEPIEYNLVQDTAHLPTWTPTVSHFPDQDHGPETTSQHDYDAISDHGSHDDGGACDGGCDGGDD